MKKQFNKIDLQFQLPEIFPIKVKFIDTDTVYNFGKHFDTDFSRTFAKVFYEKGIIAKIGTRELMYGAVNKFFTYLSAINITKIKDFERQHLSGFALWIDDKKLSLSTKYCLYQRIESLFKEFKKIKNFPLQELKIPSNPFKNIKSTRVAPKILNADQVKIILSICYTNIDNIMKEFIFTQEKLKELDKTVEYEFNSKNIYHVVHYFYKNYGYLPLLTQLSGQEQKYIKKIGGVDEVNRRLCPNPTTLLPFYLVLLVELAANSDALRQIKLDCTVSDPLFEDRCFIVWDKARAGSEQKRNVFKKKKYGAYQIIQHLKELTQHTRNNMSEKDKEFLFVIRGEYESNKLSVVIPKRFNDEVQKFIKINNLNFVFTPSEIRPTVLTEMYHSRKDIVSVSKIANHKSINTTLLYIVNEETKKENRKYISEKQTLIFDNLSKKDVTTKPYNLMGAENVGFTCANPIVDKKACVNWMAELTNPELVIPANSKYLSRILALKNSIMKTQPIMNPERFDLLYQPILNVINNDIISRFSNDLIIESELLAKEIIIPLLGDY